MFWANWLGGRGISLTNRAQQPPPPPVPASKPPRKASSSRRPPYVKGIKRLRQERVLGHRSIEHGFTGAPLSPPAFVPREVSLAAALAVRAWWAATVARLCSNTSDISQVLALQLADSRERFVAMLTALSRRMRRDGALFRDTCRAFAVDSYSDLQDLFNSLLLAETVYKVVDQGDDGAAQTLHDMKAQYPPGLITVSSVQWALPHVTHRYLLAESDTTLFVALMGTKQRRDMFTNANVLQEVLWEDLQEVPQAMGGGVHKGAPAAHRGFLRRARAVPIEDLYLHAHRKGKKLLLCGHSLGGAVAMLCTIRLLQHLPESQQDNVKCIGFATPPIGNGALAALVKQAGWDRCLQNIMLPEDVIPRLLTFSSQVRNNAVSYLPQLQPGVLADELDVADPVDGPKPIVAPPAVPNAASTSHGATHVPAVLPSTHAGTQTVATNSTPMADVHREGSDAGTPTAVEGSYGNNILAPTLRQLRRLRRLRQHVRPAVHAAVGGEDAAVATPRGSGSPGAPGIPPAAGAPPSVEPVDNGGSPDVGRMPWQHMSVVARTATRSMSRAAQIVTSPVRATRAYVPIGRQLYVMPHNLSRTHPTPPTTPSDSTEEPPAVETVTTTQGRKRVLFHMHRMATYRGRMTAILSDTANVPVGGLLSTGKQSQLELVKSLAPQMRPLSAAGYITASVAPPPPVPHPTPLASISNTWTRQLIPLVGGMAASQSTQGRWSWPWLQFFAAREAERSGGVGAVEVVLRVTGTGLENVNSVDLATGSGSSVRAYVVNKPKNTLLLPPGTVMPPGAAGGTVARTMAWPLRLLLGPLLEGWQHVKAWTGQDPLLVRAYIPAGLLSQMADREQQANGSVQGQKLAVRIASDFQVVELPLKLEGNLTDDEKKDAEDRYKRIGRIFAASRL